MNPQKDTLPTLEELVAESRGESCRRTKRKEWRCLDGLSKEDRKRALDKLWRHLNKSRKAKSDRDWQKNNPERSRNHKANWAKRNKEKVDLYLFGYRKTDMRKNVIKRYYDSHKLEFAARRKAGRAIRSGALIKQPCEVCANPKSEAHHDDYSKPLEVRWLCKAHHSEHHSKYKLSPA
jgi:hypothetical protein